MSFRDRIKGRYAIDAKLGAGSFGEVYTCYDTKKTRNDEDIKVIKVIHIGTGAKSTGSDGETASTASKKVPR